MLMISADDVDRALTFTGLVETLANGLPRRRGAACAAPPCGRAAGRRRTTLLLMPAWTDFNAAGVSDGGHIGVKIVTVSPDNNAIAKPAVMGLYLLLDGKTGEPQALIDGQRLTQWRTASASALAASYLAREDASKLLVIGAGALCPFLAKAHSAVRPIQEIRIWNRTPANARKGCAGASQGRLERHGRAGISTRLLRWADIVSSATISAEPLVRGALLRPGVHVDLVGGFTPAMREADDDAIRRARVYVDTRAGATKEAGDIVQPLASGVLKPEGVIADLAELTRGEKPRPAGRDEITLFKSVGAALEDLAAGIAVYRAISR